jgi:hypothetical protein
MAEIRDFIEDLDIPDGEPVIFGGDFNTDPIVSDMDYQAFLDTMNPVIPQHIGYWESNFSDDFAKIIDHAWMDRYHLIPLEGTNEIITPRSLDPVLWDLYEFSDHRAVLGRFVYPDINQMGGDTLICPGENLTLSVETDYPVTYQWYRDGTEINGQTNSTLELFDAQESESGLYACLVGYDVVYGQWEDSLTAVFHPNGADTVGARLNYNYDIIIDQTLCELSVKDPHQANFNIYPNPAEGLVRIQSLKALDNLRLEIFNMSGKIIHSKSLKTEATIDFTGFSKGVYLIRFYSDTYTEYQRLVIY